MKTFFIIFGSILAFLLIIFFVMEYLFYKKGYFNECKKDYLTKYINKPYEPKGSEHLHDIQVEILEKAKELPYEDVYIKSWDNLNLHGKYYKGTSNTHFVLMVHGYKSVGIREFAGILPMYLEKGYSAIIIDQRGAGISDGECVTFGIEERKDVKSWVEYILSAYGENLKIVLTGVSMGAATVMMALDQNLPSNVIGVISDCPYASPREIITKTITKEMNLPNLFVSLSKLSGLLFAHFNFDEADCIRSIPKSNAPILIIHGSGDKYIPMEMSYRLFERYPERIKYVVIPNSPHAINYIYNEELYQKETKSFLSQFD